MKAHQSDLPAWLFSPRKTAPKEDGAARPRVYLLWHIHEFIGQEDDAKFIGVYRTQADAKAAIKRLSGKPGFRSHRKGFLISPHEVGEDQWTEGFTTVRQGTHLKEDSSRTKPSTVRAAARR